MNKKILFIFLSILILFAISNSSPKLVYATDICIGSACSPCDASWCDFACGIPDNCSYPCGPNGMTCSCTCQGGSGYGVPYSPIVAGYLKDSFNQPLANTEVDWTDIAGHIRKRWTNSDGGYYFASWTMLPNGGGYPWPDNPFMIQMHANEYGSYPSAPWLSSFNDWEAYSINQNTHIITGVKPGGLYGAMIPVNNLFFVPEDVNAPPHIINLVYKPTPTASINGPTSGQVGQSASFSATGNGPGMGQVQIYYARADLGLNLSLTGSWTLMGQTGINGQAACDGSSQCALSASFIPVLGQYYIVVNAAANFSAPATWCYGNPSGGAYADCNAGFSFPDYILFTASNPIVDGVWGGWGNCSATCNGGTQNRSCDSPPPSNGGFECLKLDGSRGLTDIRICNPQRCPIPGEWCGWGACSLTCGGGIQYRDCNCPTPLYGGAYCSGSNQQSCNTQCCPVDGVCSGWSSWSCSGNNRIRTRTYTAPICNGNNVACSPLIETFSCDDGNACTTDTCTGAGICNNTNVPVNGTWGTPFGICSAACGGGTQTMTCNGASCGGTCIGSNTQTCNNQSCPSCGGVGAVNFTANPVQINTQEYAYSNIITSYASGTTCTTTVTGCTNTINSISNGHPTNCYVTPDVSTSNYRARVDFIPTAGTPCTVNISLTPGAGTCDGSTAVCSPSASWGAWSDTGACHAVTSCKQQEIHTCATACGGQCTGLDGITKYNNGQTETRNTKDCGIVNGGWGSWQACTVSCGTGGVQYHSCLNPVPACGGADCSGPASRPCPAPMPTCPPFLKTVGGDVHANQ